MVSEAMGATPAQTSDGQESAGVAAELANLTRKPGPVETVQSAADRSGPAPAAPGRLVPDLSTATSDTYEQPDGLMTARIFASPINYLAANGTWQPISDTLVASSSGVRNQANRFSLQFPKSLTSSEMLVSGFSPSCTLNQALPETSRCNQTTLEAGYDLATKTSKHGLIQFSLNFGVKDVTVMSAKLALHVASESPPGGVTLGAWRVTTPWEAGATWNTTNGKTPWSKTKGGDYEVGSDGAIALEAKPGWAYLYPTGAVQEWINGSGTPNGEGASNDGFIVKTSPEETGVEDTQTVFDSPNEGTYMPYLDIEYAPRDIGDQQSSSTLSVPLSDRTSLGVSLGSGNLSVSDADLDVAGRGIPFDSDRTWNSRDDHIRTFGYGWSNSTNPTLEKFPENAIGYRDATGAWFRFQPNEGSYITPPGIHAILCGIISPPPCPSSLPGNVYYRLIYDQSQAHIDFTSEGFPADIQDRYDNTLTAHFTNGIDKPSSWTDTEGRTFAYSTEGPEGSERYSALKDESGGRKVSFKYTTPETEPLLTTFIDADGKETKYGYTKQLLTSITSPRGEVTKFEYDSENRITKIIRTTNSEHTTGPTDTFTYYEIGKAPEFAKKANLCTSTQKATVIKDPDWTKSGEHETMYCSNSLDEVEKTIDANGNATEASYNPLGNLTESTAAAPGNGESGDVESLGYDESGLNLLCVVAGTSTKTTSCPSTPDKSALVTSYSYKDEKNPFSATQIENPQGSNEFACYNEGVQKESKQKEIIGTECPKPSEATGPAGSLQNESDQLASEKELKFAYNSNGTIASSTDADGHTTSYEYEEEGNLKKITPPSGSGISATSITVDTDSRPHVITDGAGHVETITYNADDEITEIAYTGTGTAKTVKFEYDADGNLIKREDPTGTTKYTVDPLNRATKEELPGSLSNSYEYDAASNMTTFTDGGGTTKYKYNGLNELESMLEPGETKETKFTYDNDHRLNKITYTSGAIENYKLEPTTGRPETITAEGVTGTTVPKLTYAYKEGEDDTSLVQSLTESTGNTTSYLYDKLNRLTEAKTKSTTNPSHYLYKLDGAGNRTSQEVSTTAETGGTKTYYVLNSGNELECRQTVTGACSKNSSTELSAYTYDGAGEETAITPKADTSGTTFAYNAASETSSLTPSGSGALALSYGGTGQDDLTALGSTTTLQHSQLGLTREVSSAGTSYYARTPNGLLIDQRTPSGHYNPLYNGQGDIIGLVSSTGKVERTFRYGPYGENVKSEGTQTIPYPFGFKGGYRMPGGNKGEGNVTNGLYHFGARYYDPTTGRWTQQDPSSHVGNATQGDYFLFTGNDPINQADPSGEFSLFFPSRATCYTVAFLCLVTNNGETYEKIAEEAFDDSVTVVYEGIEDGIQIDEEL
jgi:RHS repeat-associated protein